MIVTPIRLEGRSALLAPMEASHAEDLFAISQRTEIWTYMPVRISSLEETRRWIDAALKAQERGAEAPFVILDRETDRVAGSTRFLDIDPPNRSLEIGWTWLHPDFWRTRINTECKYLLLRHCFETLKTIRVQFKTDSRNVRSQTAIERIGGVKEGILRKHRILPDGYIRDSVYYSILDDDWPEAKRRLEAMLESRG